MQSPLSNLVIVETSSEIAVRYCGKLFAAHGAHVVSLQTESRSGDAATRALAAWLDQGKDRATRLEDVSARADVVIAGQTPAEVAGVDDALAPLRASAPLRLGLTWFGETGPYAEWRGSDALIQAMSGVAYAFGPANGPPVLPQGHSPQIIAGATAFIAVVAALRGRDHGDRTARIDLNVLEAALCFSEHAPAAAAQGGPTSSRRGVNRFTPTYPQTIYPAADGWIGVTALTPLQWQALCDLVELPALGRDPELASTDQRLAAADRIDALLGPAFLTRTAGEWLVEGQARRIPLGPVPTLKELLETPHWRQRRSFQFVGLADAPGLEGPAMPFRHHSHNGDGDAHRPAPAAPGADGPLAGIRVLDLAMGWSGPLAARHLADLGADVIKVEGTANLDWWRGWNGPEAGNPPPHEMRPNFNAVNRNKRGISLNLRDPRGLDLARRLAAQADVLIENYAPGVLDRLGLSASVLTELNPNLVYISMGAFGSAGPWSGFRAYGSTTEQASGFPFVNGAADWAPCLQHIAYGDPIAGIYAAIAALIALHGRQAAGGGAVIDLSQVECLFQLNAPAILAQSATGLPPARTGSRRAGSWLSDVLPAAGADEWLAIDIADKSDAARLATIIGLADGSAPDVVAARLAGWSVTRAPAEAAQILQRAGIAAAPVLRASSLLNDPHLVATGFWRRAHRAYVGEHVLPAPPYRLDGTRPALRRVAPTAGEHCAEVLSGDLGLSPHEVAALEQDGIIGTRRVAGSGRQA